MPEPTPALTEEKPQAVSTEEWAARIASYCVAAGVTGIGLRVVTLHCQGQTPTQIRHATGRRVSEVQEILVPALKAVSLQPGFQEAAQAFPGDLLHCAEDRRTYDERAPGVRGVSPARASQRFQGGRIVAPDDRRIRQDDFQAGRLWGLALRGPEPCSP